jgi:protein KRI1
VEEKYGKGRAFQDPADDSEDSQEGVEEDDAAELLDETLDDEVNATLQALRAKDPRIYNKEVKFYREADEDGGDTDGVDKEQSMTLKQYHTKNLLDGTFTAEDYEDAPPKTYAQEQEEVRQNLVKEMHAAADEDGEGDDFLVAKPKPKSSKKDRVKITAADVVQADKDPETFLSNFMASRAWVPSGTSRFQPLDSDDSSEEAAADEWENSYNLYFEDTSGANEKIMSYARDAVASTTVRRDDATGRRKAREAARTKREQERQQKEQELARLRKLKVEEMEQKVQQIRKIGGLSGRDFKMDEWKDVLEADWSDDQWDVEMQKRFGDSYYEERDAGSDDEGAVSKKKGAKKPKFDDDIDIKDLIPDFKDDEDERPDITLSSDEEDVAQDSDANDEPSASKKSSKKRKQDRADAKSAARRDRRLIENLVDSNLEYETKLAAKPNAPTRFRYRETSPISFGLTPRDILLADDKDLNEFAGLKKFASFRDPAKKKKDKKHLSKKARLRQWRKDTFGDEDGPKGGFEGGELEEGVGEGENVVEGKKKKKKRSRKRKGGDAEI